MEGRAWAVYSREDDRVMLWNMTRAEAYEAVMVGGLAEWYMGGWAPEESHLRDRCRRQVEKGLQKWRDGL